METKETHLHERFSQNFSGATTDLKDLIELRYSAKAVGYQRKIRAESQISGLISSNIKGRGIDFSEVRRYQPGDDIRNIDWKVTARTQSPHTKLFTEEKERPVFFLVDQSASMFFGSKVTFKSVVAARTASILAWSALEQGDRIGGIIFSDLAQQQIRPKRNIKTVLMFLKTLNDFNHELTRSSKNSVAEYGEKQITRQLVHLRRIIKDKSLIFFISDFSKLNFETSIELKSLARSNKIVGVHIYDQMERQLPPPNLYTVTDGTSRSKLNTSGKELNQNYSRKFDARLEKIISEFKEINSSIISLSTTASIEKELLKSQILNQK